MLKVNLIQNKKNRIFLYGKVPKKHIFARNFFLTKYFFPILPENEFPILDLLLPSVKCKFKSKLTKSKFLTCKSA